MHTSQQQQKNAPSGKARGLHRLIHLLLVCCFAAVLPAGAATRLIVRVQGGLLPLQTICALLGCNVQYGLGDPQGQVFLITSPLNLTPNLFLNLNLGVLDAEIDVQGRIMDAVNQGAAPAALFNSTPVSYYGTTVRQGYLLQPATQIVELANAQSTYHVSGSGIVAVIDTGVDTTHPVLQPVLLPGYDFTRNRSGADEKGDVTQSTTAVVDQSTTAVVDQSTTAVVDGTTGSNLDKPQYADFGHGTMVSGVVHLVAPTARILPLKAFHADGTGYLSDVIRALYYAARNNANVINMSFNFTTPSNELYSALSVADLKGIVLVAAAGNSGQQTLVYPAAYQSLVMGVASTSNNDTLSTFSNYGPKLVWVGAPGEGVVTLFPYGTYAATWGTSFSTPFVAGTASLLLNAKGYIGETAAAQAIANAVPISPAVGHGRLDIYLALRYWLSH
jgi:subtilisin family serine protease